MAAVLDALPQGQTSNYAGTALSVKANVITELAVQTYLDTGNGPGMIRLSAREPEDFPNTDPSSRLPGTRSWTQADGDMVTMIHIPDNCIQTLVVNVVHSDGESVQLDVASCLA